jgi:hypothetical protein
VLTTNYDSFIEDAFPSYTKYIGQEELLFSTLHGISEIYKIHGCCTKPESVIINEADYADFAEKNAYLAAKILTIFLEHPIVFIGYSINDTNIENILKSIVKCLSTENLEKIRERLIFIERAKDGAVEEVSAYSKAFEGGKSIEMTRVRLKSYETLYQALLENQAKYNAPMLRRLKQDIYELVLTNKPTGRIRTVNLEDEKLEDVEVVIGVGVHADFGQKGYAGLTAEELYADVVLDNRDFDAESIIWKALSGKLYLRCCRTTVIACQYTNIFPNIQEICRSASKRRPNARTVLMTCFPVRPKGNGNGIIADKRQFPPSVANCRMGNVFRCCRISGKKT